MRALLVVNPKATTTSERGRDVLVRALGSEVDLRVEYTRRRGHASALARQAAKDGVDVIVTLGGDGTVWVGRRSGTSRSAPGWGSTPRWYDGSSGPGCAEADRRRGCTFGRQSDSTSWRPNGGIHR
jgi:hypothetical protein